MKSNTFTKEQIAAFLTDLAAVCRKHKIEVQSCGCCGSPFLGGVEPGDRTLSVTEGWMELEFRSAEELAKIKSITENR